MSGKLTLGERLKSGLARTRAKLTLPWSSSEAPDWDALEESLILADVGLAATTDVLDRMREARGEPSLRDELLSILGEVGSEAAASRPKPRVTVLVGVNGVGKTTTVAKLAQRARERGDEVLVVAADTFRAAAQEQLATWCERLLVPVVQGDPGQDPASVAHDGVQAALSRGVDEVFVDTAGRLHTKRPLMDELQKIARVMKKVVETAPHETLLVMDATVGSNGLAQAREFEAALPLTGIVLTKMDGTARGGVVFAIAKELGLSVRYVGMGESAADLLDFDPEAFVDALLEPEASPKPTG